MADLNRVFLMGNLTRDPEVRYTPSGKAVGDLRLAITSRFKNNEDVCYVDVTVWDRQAETCGEYLRKGSPVMVEGRLKFDEWERDGQKRSKLSVVASRVQFMGSPRGAEYRDGSGSQGAPGGRDERSADADRPPAQDEPPAEGAEDDDNLPF